MINLDYEKMGKLIEKLRIDYNMSQADLAKVVGVSAVSVTKWENGSSRCSINNIVKLAEFFNITTDEIIEGKLHNEGTIDYLKRNFDLTPFNLDELIKHKKISRISEYFRKCLSIKNRYWWLLPRWSRNELNDGEKEEFKYLEQYIVLDVRLFNGKYKLQSIMNNVEDVSLKECVKEFYEKLEGLSQEERDWEVSKLIEYNFKINAPEIIALGDIDCTALMLNLCNQQYKDELVALNIKGKTSQDLTDNEHVCNLVWAGGNCIYRFIGYINSVLDEELLDYIEGSIVEDTDRTTAWEYCLMPGYNFGGEVQIYDYVDEWKTMSYKEYEKTIMKKKTKYIDDLGSTKYYNPELFYKNLLNGEYDTYL